MNINDEVKELRRVVSSLKRLAEIQNKRISALAYRVALAERTLLTECNKNKDTAIAYEDRISRLEGRVRDINR